MNVIMKRNIDEPDKLSHYSVGVSEVLQQEVLWCKQHIQTLNLKIFFTSEKVPLLPFLFESTFNQVNNLFKYIKTQNSNELVPSSLSDEESTAI